jgi:hypothetical protein
MMLTLKNTFLLAILISSIFFLSLESKCQTSPTLQIQEGHLIRVEGRGEKMSKSFFTLNIPPDSSLIGKLYTNQDILLKSKIKLTIDRSRTTLDLTKTNISGIQEFQINRIDTTNRFKFQVSVPRDSLDDKLLVIAVNVFDSLGIHISNLDTSVTFYVKPAENDSLSSSKDYEFWLLTGTNFDFFDGVKAEEFFFRANMLVKITDNILAQVAFYRNRYFDADSSTGRFEFNTVLQPRLGDSVYTLVNGSYSRASKQTVDPLSFQFDLLGKLTKNETSNFFFTTGFEASVTSVSLASSRYNLDTAFFLRTSKPDTVSRFSYTSRLPTFAPEIVKYRKPAYLLSVGLMWILDDREINIKAQIKTGMSVYSELESFVETRGRGTTFNFDKRERFFIQYRMFATYKPFGLTFGLETFLRTNELPAFNFTLSKAFDLRGFSKNLSSVSSLGFK